jgi:hypothetical protein
MPFWRMHNWMFDICNAKAFESLSGRQCAPIHFIQTPRLGSHQISTDRRFQTFGRRRHSPTFYRWWDVCRIWPPSLHPINLIYAGLSDRRNVKRHSGQRPLPTFFRHRLHLTLAAFISRLEEPEIPVFPFSPSHIWPLSPNHVRRFDLLITLHITGN